MRQLLILAMLTTQVSSACVSKMQNQRHRSERLSPADTLIAYENETWSLIKQRLGGDLTAILAEDF